MAAHLADDPGDGLFVQAVVVGNLFINPSQGGFLHDGAVALFAFNLFGDGFRPSV